VEQREKALEERACVPKGQDFLFHSPKNAPGSALSSVLSGPQLLTSMLDAERSPATEIIELYHQRWELETGCDELHTHTLERLEALSSLDILWLLRLSRQF
jgi:hypothetical protein